MISPIFKEIPESEKLIAIHQREYLCEGQMKTWNGEIQTVLSPIQIETEKGFEAIEIGSYPLTGIPEAQEALDSAIKAYDFGRGEWPNMALSDRINCLLKFIDKMFDKKEQIVNLLMWEIGKPKKDSIKEFDRTVQYLYDTIDAAKHIDRISSGFEIQESVIGQIRRSPLGIVLCMGPFNYPLNETYTTLIPALLMGNVILFKPPKFGTLLHYPLMSAFAECFPKGAVNYVYGRGHNVVPTLMQSGQVNVLTLIGSSRVADSLIKMHPKSNRLRPILGLDAKNAGVILKSADIDLAVNECLTGSLSFNGQRCTALKIIFVHQSWAETFLSKFNEKVDQLVAGMPWTEGVQITPLPEPQKPDYLKELISDAESKGAKIMNKIGGLTFGSLVMPTVLYPVKEGMKIYREEQFGPVVPIVPFNDVNEVIDYIITSDHGQQISIFGKEPQQVSELIDVMVNQVSRVNINAQCQRGPDTFPFTGRKDSAEGLLSVDSALRSFSIRTVVATKETSDNKELFNTIINNHSSNFLSTKFIF